MNDLCNFCFEQRAECNCPSDMTPVRQKGADYFNAILNNNLCPEIVCPAPRKILGVGETKVEEYGSVAKAYITKCREFKRSLDNDDEYFAVDMKYLGLPEGTRLKVTIEVLDDKNN